MNNNVIDVAAVRKYMWNNRITQTALAKEIGRSRVRVNQVLNFNSHVKMDSPTAKLIWDWYLEDKDKNTIGGK